MYPEPVEGLVSGSSSFKTMPHPKIECILCRVGPSKVRADKLT